MSTRGMYNFGDGINVYCHYDNYPEGAEQRIINALHLAWDLPRYEPDEFAAAFVAGNKTKQGNVRIMPSGDPVTVANENCADIEFLYEIRAVDTVIYVKAFTFVGFINPRATLIYDGPLSKLREAELIEQ